MSDLTSTATCTPSHLYPPTTANTNTTTNTSSSSSHPPHHSHHHHHSLTPPDLSKTPKQYILQILCEDDQLFLLSFRTSTSQYLWCTQLSWRVNAHVRTNGNK
eukprot:TRINITY_DN10667_c0_g1_i2.p1 TRINITY_DN10667_c0_g1~~TRINITY_DN10667_c0_g1_i2.p1  ORF type:complete len:103 (+),score=22.75 TRINITY_DN10667_c0_g1_i2:313-621(+)